MSGLPFNGFVVDTGGGGSSVSDPANFPTSLPAADNEIIRSDGTAGGLQGSNVTIADTTGTVTFPQGASLTTAGGASVSLDAGGAGRVAISATLGGEPVIYTDPGNGRVAFDDAVQIGWSTNVYGAANDTGLARSSAGVVKVTDGGAGSGKIGVANGDATSPSYGFSSNADTGIFLGTGVAVAYAGVKILDIYSAGIYINAAATTHALQGNGTFVLGLKKDVEQSQFGSGAPHIITASESCRVFTNEGSTAENYHTLPAASAGLNYTFVVQDADGIRITADAGDTIRPIAGTAASATGGFIRCATQGAFITLLAINDTEWIAIGSAGVWTIDA